MENMMHYLKDIDKEKLKTVLEIKEAYNGGRMSLEEAKRILKEKVKVFDLSKKENDDYFTRRKIGAFDSDLQSNSLLITKIWDFNKNILKEWADVKLLLDINDRAKTQKMKKGLKSIVKDFKKIAEYLEDICFDSSEIKEDEVIIIDEKNGKKE